MLPAAHLAELERALGGLSAVLGARLAERLPEPMATPAPDSSLPQLGGPEQLPPASVFEGDGPLATIIDDVGLKVGEALILAAAVAPEIDERYAPLTALLSGRVGAPAGLTGEGARNLAARTFAGKLAAADQLSATAPLRASGLIELDGPSDEGLLAARLLVDPSIGAWILGRPRELPVGTPGFPAAPMSTVHDLGDVIVSGTGRRALQSLVARIRDRQRVNVDWGFGRHHDGAGGIVAMFHGPSGTGKTMAAAVVAREAGLPAFRVDLSMLVSKYIGETEKNLAKIFDVAERADCVLVFDEADAIFGSRTEVGDARDRYANQEVSYLLQRIERHPGVVILTTNLQGNIDDAFQRRISVSIPFPAPTPVQRQDLWTRVFPPELPTDAGLDISELAERFDLTGAAIRDATLEAAFIAADNGQVVTREHLITAITAQYAKSSRMLPAEHP